MTLIFLPMMPPLALISSAASRSESRTVCSLMAMAPDVEFSKPSLTVSPLTHVPDDDEEAAVVSLPPDESEESSPHALTSNAQAATIANAHLDVLPNRI